MGAVDYVVLFSILFSVLFIMVRIIRGMQRKTQDRCACCPGRGECGVYLKRTADSGTDTPTARGHSS